jgi:hypothetical protein
LYGEAAAPTRRRSFFVILSCHPISTPTGNYYDENLEAVTMSFSRFPTAHDIAIRAGDVKTA